MAFWNRKKKEETKETSRETQSRAAQAARRGGFPALQGVKHIIAIASGKGGVGKSTLSANLAVALRFSGARVGLLDADIYGASQPGMFGAGDVQNLRVEDNMLHPVEKHGVRFVSMGLLMGGDDGPVVWRAPMVVKLLQQFLGQVAWGELDYLLIDLPPGTGDIQLTLAQQASLSGAVIVTTPQNVAVGIAAKGMRMFEKVNVPILGVIENMSGFTCENCDHVTHIFQHGGGKQMAKDNQIPFLGAVPLDTDIVESGDSGQPILLGSTESPAAKAFLDIAQSLEKNFHELVDEANEGLPLEETVDPETGNVTIKWVDGETTKHSAYNLRVECRCALCVDEDTGKPLLDPKRVPLDIQVVGMRRTGRYAYTITFSDNHNTGIYTFDRLRQDLAEDDAGDNSETFSV